MCTFSHSSFVSKSQCTNHIAHWTCTKCTWLTLYTNPCPLYVMLPWPHSIYYQIPSKHSLLWPTVCTTILKSCRDAGKGRLLPPILPAHDAAKKSLTQQRDWALSPVIVSQVQYPQQVRSRTSGEPFTSASTRATHLLGVQPRKVSKNHFNRFRTLVQRPKMLTSSLHLSNQKTKIN